jgi:predicted DNA-binding transcriptional regulator YafY
MPDSGVAGTLRYAGGMLRSAHPLIPRVERQHALIEALRVRAPRATAGAILADRLGVSVRTVERDVAALRGAGVPITTGHGPGGGYAFDARRELPPVRLTPGDDVEALAPGRARSGGASRLTRGGRRSRGDRSGAPCPRLAGP